MSRAIVIDVGAGTPEASWAVALGTLPPLTHLPRTGRVVVVAPHPDDEVLGCGGLLMALQRRGVELDLVGVTDGEASHPGSRCVTPARLGLRRRDEAAEADRRLGILARRRWVGVPDGAVGRSEARLVDVLTAVLAGRSGQGDPGAGAALCVAPWEGDGHPDHEATGRAAREAADRLGVPLLAYPVWAWHWASPERGDLPLERASALALDADQLRRKEAAIAAHRSQIEPLGPDPADAPVLTDAVLVHFRRPFEVFLR